MESLRYVVCGRPECRQVFFLCSGCDRGRRYCGRVCSRAARCASVRAAGARYQRSREGARSHAARTAAWRARRQKVTHQARGEEAREASVVDEPVPDAASVADVVRAERSEAPVHAPATPSRPTCARCGRASAFLRHTTLARTHVGARWRASVPP